MDIRHKKQAIIGISLWAAAIPIFLVVGVFAQLFAQLAGIGGKNIAALGFLLFLPFQYGMFFWGGKHLCRAKGYPAGMLLFGIFWPAQLFVLAVLLFGLPDKRVQSSGPVRKSRGHHGESFIARVVRFRRNALVAILFGIFGIIVALSLALFSFGPFVARDNNTAAATFVFVPSYVAVIYGCWWWLKAKFWHEGVILIGVVPVLVLFVPYVRLIYVAVPMLLPATMTLMPIILLGVIAVLPDKSGMPRQRR